MTFTYTALEDQNQAVFEKYLKFSKKFDLYQLKLPNLFLCKSTVVNRQNSVKCMAKFINLRCWKKKFIASLWF